MNGWTDRDIRWGCRGGDSAGGADAGGGGCGGGDGSHRAYRPMPGLDKALEEIGAQRGILYDPAVVDACIRIFREKDFRLA